MTIYAHKNFGSWQGDRLHGDFLTIGKDLLIANFINREECEKVAALCNAAQQWRELAIRLATRCREEIIDLESNSPARDLGGES